ncbi:hypothetical protein FRX31_007688 [Thalictrum thalictroides]|uniref:DUF4283 domain-containing protein n=1 Tax=Thalictrum thalictroides TaxID=46969 RepID=A0A7J6WZ73_THATH|nr:hypothetical protein FRX31_007688 [Thalictrum thalictroides]
MNGSRKVEGKEIDEATAANPRATLGLKRGFLSSTRHDANQKSSSDLIGIGKPNLCSNLEKNNTEVGAGMTSSSNMEVNCNMALIPNPSLIPKNNGDGHKRQILQVSSSTHEEEIDLETRREHEDQPVVEDGSVHGKKLGFHEEQARNPNEGTKPSWSSILGRQVVSKKSLSFYAPTIVEGKPIVHVQSSQFTHLQKQFENLIIGGFVSKKLPFGFVRETLTRTWRLKNNFIMKQYGEMMYSFKFMSDDDRKQVLEMGSLHIASQLFILRPWKLFVEAEFNDLKTIPVWVVMKRFPMELWDDEGFGRVASTIGKPLFVDKLTESMTRTSYARVCVEIDTKCTYPDHATVVLDEQRTFKIPFEYNWRGKRSWR